MIVKVKRLPNSTNLPLPEYQKPGDSGKDLRAAIEQTVVVKSMEIVKIPTGIALELPFGAEAQVRPRSSLSLKGILVYFGTCDAAYTGEICVVLQNLSGQDFVIERGNRIAQLVVAEPVHFDWQETTGELKVTSRVDNGFGSTGVK